MLMPVSAIFRSICRSSEVLAPRSNDWHSERPVIGAVLHWDPSAMHGTSEAPVDGSANRGLRAPTAQGGAPNFGTHLTIRLREVSSSLSPSPQRMPTMHRLDARTRPSVDLFRRCLSMLRSAALQSERGFLLRARSCRSENCGRVLTPP